MGPLGCRAVPGGLGARRFEAARTEAAALDQYYIPTRYPNGLPGGIPAEAYARDDAERALPRSGAVIDLVTRKASGSS